MDPAARQEYSRGARFDVAHVVGDPFALATISISILAWLIAFVSSVIADVTEGTFPNFAWWGLVFMFFYICGVLVTVASDSVATYHVAIVGFTAAGLVLVSAAVQHLVYSPEPAKQAAAAGFILLAMVSIVWIFYFGSQPHASHRAFVDSYALHKGDRRSLQNARTMSANHLGARSETAHHPAPQMYTSAQLNGFETSSPVTAFASGNHVDQRNSSQPRFGAGGSNTLAPSAGSTTAPVDTEIPPPTEYPYRAKAIYSYDANPDDANEISFSKHEILEVSDVSGRWWQAKKENGETGIAPSNYLILL